MPEPIRFPFRGARFCALTLALGGGPAAANQVVVPAPDAGNEAFGQEVVALPNGHYVVHDPEWSAGGNRSAAGAVYLYAADGTLLSRLTGSRAGDRVGSGGITVLPTGDFLVSSPRWDADDDIADAGAVTWGDAHTGFGTSAIVSAANSLVGSSAHDRVGEAPPVVLADGDYVVASGGWDVPGGAVDAGAATWCAQDGSTVGAVGPDKSLTGVTAGDQVGGTTIGGTPGVVALANGHYVVVSSRWDRGAVPNAGAVTWGDGDGGTLGAVGAGNSLSGARAEDHVATEVVALTNGHYVVLSYLWDSPSLANVGAATWADGTQPTVGEVSPANSLVGAQEGDRAGFGAAPLANGHYVVSSPFWDAGAVVDAGAVTWRDGSAASPGIVSAANSLVGSQLDDTIGRFTTVGIPPLGVVPLADGDYVVASPSWDDGEVANVGAATLLGGDSGFAGTVTAANSLVGSTAADKIAQFIVALPSGDYVVASPLWSARRGAATWGDGAAGVTGVLSDGNSLVGSTPDDFVSSFGIAALAGGGYVVSSARWTRGAAANAGAVTHAPPGGIAGAISPSNSLVGFAQGDAVGAGGAVPLPTGGYLVQSGLPTGQGAITRFEPAIQPTTGELPLARSLLGLPEDRVGPPGADVQTDGTIVLATAVATPADARGAITLLRADDPFAGTRPEEDTVRSAANGGGPRMSYAYLPATRTLVVGDPAANRLVRLQSVGLLRDGFE